MTTRTQTATHDTGSRTATIYRMVMPDQVCPYGIKTLDLLQREGFDVNDVHLETDQETTAFREKWEVETTPQTFVALVVAGGETLYTRRPRGDSDTSEPQAEAA